MVQKVACVGVCWRVSGVCRRVPACARVCRRVHFSTTQFLIFIFVKSLNYSFSPLSIHGQLATSKKSHLTRFHFVSTWPDDVGLTGDSKVYVEDLKDLNL